MFGLQSLVLVGEVPQSLGGGVYLEESIEQVLEGVLSLPTFSLDVCSWIHLDMNNLHHTAPAFCHDLTHWCAFPIVIH